MSLFDELEEQMQLAVDNLKQLNNTITRATEALNIGSTTAEVKTEKVQETAEVTEEKEVVKKKSVRKKRISKKKEEPKVEMESIAEEMLDEGSEDTDTQTMTSADVRKRIQDVAMALDGDTKIIGALMLEKFNKSKLSEFDENEYESLVNAVEALVAETDSDPLA